MKRITVSLDKNLVEKCRNAIYGDDNRRYKPINEILLLGLLSYLAGDRVINNKIKSKIAIK